MIENIIQVPQGYRATIDGVELSIPNAPGNRHFQMVQEAIAAGAEVTIEEPPVPPAAPVPDLTFAQLLIGLVAEGWITEDEGEAWLSGVLPQQVTDLIATLPTEHQFAAKARAARPSVVLRADPMINTMADQVNKTPEELDQFFITYSEV